MMTLLKAMIEKLILQGLRVAQAAVTKRCRKKQKNISYAKILGGEIISHMGDSPKWVKSKRRRKKKKKLNDGKNNGQATHGARKHAWRTQAAWAKRKKKEERERESESW